MQYDFQAFAERARLQSDAFLERTRQQMASSLYEQRATSSLGVSYPGGVTYTGLGPGYPQAGTPAGRLLDTISDLARRGASLGYGATAGPVVAGSQTLAQLMGTGIGFAAGGQAFGPSGIVGGAMMGHQRRMSLWQTAYTAFGADLPYIPGVGELGRYAGQRLDMDKAAAQRLARDELSYRFVGGAQRGFWGALDTLSFGMAGFQLRRHGMTLQTARSEDFTRYVQGQMQFMTREDLAGAGLEDTLSPFGRGVTRRGARAIADPIAERLGVLEREMGLSPGEMMGLTSRAMGTMGIMQSRNLLRTKGVSGLAAEVGRQTLATRDIQQTLNLNEKEAAEFFNTIGQMHGTAERIAGMAREARQYANRWGMSHRQVFDIMREFEQLGMTTALGQQRARGMAMATVGELREQQRLGIVGREELMMYGGRTEEEALAIQARVRVQRNLTLLDQRRLGGLEILMAGNQGQFQRFMGGRMGPMEAAGAVGGAMAANPWLALQTRYDPRVRAQVGQLGWRMQFQRVRAEAQAGFFIGGTEAEQIFRFEQLTGMEPMEASRWFRVFMREQNVFQRQAGGDPKRMQAMQNVYQQLLSANLLGVATSATGESSPYEAVGKLVQQMINRGEDPTGPTFDVEDSLRRAMRQDPRGSPGSLAQALAPSLQKVIPYVQSAGAMRAIPTQRTMAGGPRFVGGEFLTPEQVATAKLTPVAGTTRQFVTTARVRPVLQGLVNMGADDATLARFMFGLEGDLRIHRTARRSLLKGGEIDSTFEVRPTVEGTLSITKRTDGEVIFQNKEVKLEELDDLVGKDVSHEIWAHLQRGLGQRLGAGSEKFIDEEFRRGNLRGPARLAYEAFVFGRIRGTAETIFMPEGGREVADIREFTRRLATANAEEVTRMTQRGYGGLAFLTGGTIRVTGGQARVADMARFAQAFGDQDLLTKLISEQFQAENIAPQWTPEKIKGALAGGEQGAALAQLIEGQRLYDLIGQMGKMQEFEKSEAPMGTFARPIHVVPGLARTGPDWKAAIGQIENPKPGGR